MDFLLEIFQILSEQLFFWNTNWRAHAKIQTVRTPVDASEWLNKELQKKKK